MARAANTPREIALQSLGYVRDQIEEALKNLADAEGLINRLVNEASFTQANIDAYKTQLMNQSKTANSNAVAMYRWILGEFSIPIPTALTDTDVDTIDEDIRTHDDGQ